MRSEVDRSATELSSAMLHTQDCSRGCAHIGIRSHRYAKKRGKNTAYIDIRRAGEDPLHFPTMDGKGMDHHTLVQIPQLDRKVSTPTEKIVFVVGLAVLTRISQAGHPSSVTSEEVVLWPSWTGHGETETELKVR